MKFGAVPLKTPLVGWLTTVAVSELPSASVPAKTIAFATSSSVVTDCATATGTVLAAGAAVPITTVPCEKDDCISTTSGSITSSFAGSSIDLTRLLVPLAPIASKDTANILLPSARLTPRVVVSSQENVNTPVSDLLIS